jgi:hypothetical protein
LVGAVEAGGRNPLHFIEGEIGMSSTPKKAAIVRHFQVTTTHDAKGKLYTLSFDGKVVGHTRSHRGANDIMRRFALRGEPMRRNSYMNFVADGRSPAGRDSETAMRAAFLRAMLRWAQRANRSGPIVLPAGYTVDPAELLKVVTALKCAGRERERRVA